MKAGYFALGGALAMAVGTSLAGCDKAGSTVATQRQQSLTPVSGGALTWGVTTEPACFDPHRSSQQNSFWVIRNFIDSLISKKTDGTYAPWLATSWTVADDGKSYTFNLRDDVKFTDGMPFNAAAVKANFDYILNNVSTTSASASLLVHYDHAEIVSPYVVKLVMKQPDSTTLESLSSVKLGFISPKALVENKDLCNGGPGVVGTGPITAGRRATRSTRDRLTSTA